MLLIRCDDSRINLTAAKTGVLIIQFNSLNQVSGFGLKVPKSRSRGLRGGDKRAIIVLGWRGLNNLLGFGFGKVRKHVHDFLDIEIVGLGLLHTARFA